MRKIILITLFICMAQVIGYTQNATVKSARHKHKHSQKSKQGITMPSWAEAHHYDATAHVYFPDYYLYYDPARGGYAYWEKDKYVFTPAMPPFMEKVDLSKSRIQILKGLSLDLHPEQDYPYYMKLYPPDPNNNTKVPTPIPGNPAQH